MKTVCLFAALVFALMACGDASTSSAPIAEKTPATVVSTTVDSTAAAAALHRFFAWYNTNQETLNKYAITNDKGKHLQLDEKQLAAYLAEFKKSGVVSDEFVADETKFYQACAKLWQNENIDDVPSGMDADRMYCAQDYVGDYATAPVKVVVNGDRATATLMPGEDMKVDFELKKENGQWLLAKTKCDCGVAY